MSESGLKRLVEAFIEEFWKLEPLKDAAIRVKAPSKHQRKLRQLIDMVRVFEAKYALKHADPDYVVRGIRKDEGTKDED